MPVCNSFQAKIFNDQLCYELDLNNFTNKHNVQEELKSGFNFIMDYNEDRQVLIDRKLIGNQLEKLEAARSAYLWLPYWAILGLTKPYSALIGHTLLGLTGPYWALLCLT